MKLSLKLTHPTETLLLQISSQMFTRDNVADTYFMAMNSDWRTDWKKVNAAIMRRWSTSALLYIKTRAWNLNDALKEGG